MNHYFFMSYKFQIDKLWKCINEMAGGKYSVFARNAGIPYKTLKAWLDGSQPTKEKIQNLLNHTGHLEEYFYTPIEHEETPEHIHTPRHDPDHGSYILPDSGNQAVAKKLEPDFNYCVELLADIFRNGATSTVAAIKSNLEGFHENVKERATMKQELDELRNKLASLEKRFPEDEADNDKPKTQKGGATA